MPGSYPYASEYTAVPKCSTICRVAERKKLANDLRSTCESEVQVWEQTLLVQRILRGHSRAEQRANRGVYTESVTRRRMADQISMKEYLDPFTGAKNK